LEQTRQNTVQIRDINSFEELFSMHYANLCSYANKYVEDLDAAEEIVQDVFVKLWERRNKIEIKSSLQSYIFRAVRNSCLNQIKHKKIEETYKSQSQHDPIAKQQNLEDEIHASELENSIREAIDQLPMQRRKVFIMSRYDGLKYREIAEELNISNNTVENHMGKALKFMKEKLAHYLALNILILIKFLGGDGWM